MAGGANKAFVENPHAFLNQNLIVVKEGNWRSRLGVGSNQFEAWFLPWQPDKTFQLTLDNSAQFLFTPGMSGCTFVSAAGNTPTVAHLNYLTPGTENVSDVITAKKVSDVFSGQRVARTRREDYKADGSPVRRVFVVGWRGHNKWAFYAQQLDIVGAALGQIWRRLRAPESLKYALTRFTADGDGVVEFAEVKSVSMRLVLEDYGVLERRRRSGKEPYRGRCPIHRGEGVLHAHLGKKAFHCFSCGAGGNVLDLVANIEQCSLRQAALRLQRRHGPGGCAAPAQRWQPATFCTHTPPNFIQLTRCYNSISP